jgi:threonine dehydrogenase-like Zn-dependent dehydrogenase
LEAYLRGTTPLPKDHWLWPLYGQGLDNLGRDERPIQVPLPEPGPDQLLVRHDAVGLCFSDTKVINVGEAHPRLLGRNMRTDPVVLGHEVALTVVAVGENLADRFHQGQRFIIQADIYYKGVGLAYGYALQGGLSQYNLVGEEILNGDEGCYLLPLAPQMGYAQGALTEPWACVVAAYGIQYRSAWKPGGRVLIVSGPAADAGATLGDPYAAEGPPEVVVALGLPTALLAELQAQAADRGHRVEVVPSLDALAGQTYDDIVLLGADNALYEAAQPLAANGALINLVGAGALRGLAQVDVGRLHYDHLGLVGTVSACIADGYTPIRTEFRPGGAMLLMGAAGPMGQMHFQRALQAAECPRLILATSRVMDRLALLPQKFAQLIEARCDVTRVAVQATGRQPAPELYAELRAETGHSGGLGYDDIIIMAPSTQVVAEAAELLAPGGVINIFAGLPRGTTAPIPLADVAVKGIRLVGSSGSAIADLRRMLVEAESGRIDPNLSVVAVAGLSAAKEGIVGVIEQQFPGKVVIYPQVLDFPLTLLPDLKERLPGVYAKLGPNESWTVEAEQAFLRELLP